MNAGSKHPPAILKNIPKGINKRISEISANQEVFDLAAPLYQAELDRCGYTHQLKYLPSEKNKQTEGKKKKRSNKNRVTWFNPPYSLNVETNVGKIFLQLLDTHFPPGHILRSVMNRNSVKISYRCLPNIGSFMAKHNSKILSQESDTVVKPLPLVIVRSQRKVNAPYLVSVTKMELYTRLQ